MLTPASLFPSVLLICWFADDLCTIRISGKKIRCQPDVRTPTVPEHEEDDITLIQPLCHPRTGTLKCNYHREPPAACNSEHAGSTMPVGANVFIVPAGVLRNQDPTYSTLPHTAIGSRIPHRQLLPLGLLSIGGPLINSGHEVESFDAEFGSISIETGVTQASVKQPDVVLVRPTVLDTCGLDASSNRKLDSQDVSKSQNRLRWSFTNKSLG